MNADVVVDGGGNNSAADTISTVAWNGPPMANLIVFCCWAFAPFSQILAVLFVLVARMRPFLNQNAPLSPIVCRMERQTSCHSLDCSYSAKSEKILQLPVSSSCCCWWVGWCQKRKKLGISEGCDAYIIMSPQVPVLSSRWCFWLRSTTQIRSSNCEVLYEVFWHAMTSPLKVRLNAVRILPARENAISGTTHKQRQHRLVYELWKATGLGALNHHSTAKHWSYTQRTNGEAENFCVSRHEPCRHSRGSYSNAE